MGLLKKLFGTSSEKELRAIKPIVDKIEALDGEYSKLTDEQLKAKTPEFKQRIANGESLDDILPTAFAVCRRPLRERYLTETISGLGEVPVAPFALPSTQEVPDSVRPFVRDHSAVLLANHGAVIAAENVEEAMRLMQGYAYHFGPPMHLNTVGNQAACSDLIAKPHAHQDLNCSFLCRGARANLRAEDGELGIGIPIAQLPKVADGVIQTLSLVESEQEKDAIASRLAHPLELGREIEKNTSYMKRMDEALKALE